MPPPRPPGSACRSARCCAGPRPWPRRIPTPARASRDGLRRRRRRRRVRTASRRRPAWRRPAPACSSSSGADTIGRRHPLRRAAGARRRPRHLLGRAPVRRGVAGVQSPPARGPRPRLAASTGRHRPPVRRRGGAVVLDRSLDTTGRGAGARRRPLSTPDPTAPRPVGRRSLDDIMGPLVAVPHHPLTLGPLRSARRSADHVARPPLPDGRGTCPLGRAGRTFGATVGRTVHRGPRHLAGARRPRRGLAVRRGRLAGDRRRPRGRHHQGRGARS